MKRKLANREYFIPAIPFIVCLIMVGVAVYIFNLTPSIWWFELIPIVIGGGLSLHLYYRVYRELKNWEMTN